MSNETSGPCRECGRVEGASYMDCAEARRMKEKDLCFSCAFWDLRADERDDPASVRVDGQAYWICDEAGSPSNHGFRGFGGARWVIRFHDGRRVTSTNLWFNGAIPQHYRERYPDNATFEREPMPVMGFICAPEPSAKEPAP